MSDGHKRRIEGEIVAALQVAVADYNLRENEFDELGKPDRWLDSIDVGDDSLELTAYVMHSNGQSDMIVVRADRRSYFNYRDPHRGVGEFMWRIEEIVDTYESVGGGQSYFTLPRLVEP